MQDDCLKRIARGVERDGLRVYIGLPAWIRGVHKCKHPVARQIIYCQFNGICMARHDVDKVILVGRIGEQICFYQTEGAVG